MASPFPTGFNLVVVRLGTTMSGQSNVNVLHYTSAVGVVAPTALHTAIYNYWAATIIPPFQAASNNQLSYVYLETQLSTPGQHFMAYRGFFTGVTGSNGDVALPNEVAMVITRQSSYIGRANRGRIYLAGQTSTDVLSGTGLWTAGSVATAEAVGSVLNDSIVEVVSGSVWAPAVVPKDLHTFTPLNHYRVNTSPRVQRRRQVGVGK
jgi:hypothetical protein